MRKQSHPWLNEKCREAIEKKNEAEDTPSFEDARSSCAQVLAAEYQKHISDLKTKINALPKGSKKWWKLNRQLLEKRSKLSSIPPLKDGTKWLHDPKEKADLFARTFAKKAELPQEACDTPFFGVPTDEMNEFICLRSRTTMKLFKSLNEAKATGPDKIPAAILKRVANWIAVPFTIVCRRMLAEACWPKI